MTPREVIIIVTAIAVIVIVAQYFYAQHLIHQHGQTRFEAGWLEGWDDRDADHPPTTTYEGQHREPTAAETEDAITELMAVIPAPLPKRTPKART